MTNVSVTNVNTAEPPCKLYLIVEAGEGPIADDWLGKVLEAAPISCVLFAARAASPWTPTELQPAISAAQDRGIAALVENGIKLCSEVSADGVHIAANAELQAAYDSARSELTPGTIVGADPGPSRHAAMLLAEQGADYVTLALDAGPDGASAQLARTVWWAEIFELPCVAWDVRTPESASALAAAGADFAAVRVAAGGPADEICQQLVAISAALAAVQRDT